MKMRDYSTLHKFKLRNSAIFLAVLHFTVAVHSAYSDTQTTTLWTLKIIPAI